MEISNFDSINSERENLNDNVPYYDNGNLIYHLFYINLKFCIIL